MKNKLEIIIGVSSKTAKVGLANFQSAFKKSFGNTQKTANALSKSIGKVNASVSGMTKVIGGIAVGAMTRGFFRAGVEVQQLNRGFAAITGSAAAADKEISFLREATTRLGLEFYTTADAFKDISAAAQDTAMQGAPVRDIFLGIAEASSALGMSADATQGALRAISQMMSKGNVQAEELRGQLGERLPGAFQLAAKAMGLTTQQLNKQLELGKVLATDMLPKLAKVLHEKYGKAAVAASGDALQSLNRFKTAWKDMVAAVANSGFMEIAATKLKMLTKTLKDPALIQSVQDFAASFFTASEAISKFVVEYKNFILVVAGSTATVLILGKISGALIAMGAALKYLLGLEIMAWFQLLFTGVGSAAGEIAALPGGIVAATAAIAALGTAALLTGWKFGRMVKDFFATRQEMKELVKQSEVLIDKFDKFKDFKMPDMAGKTVKEIEAVSRSLHKARKYWEAIIKMMEASGDTQGLDAANTSLKSVNAELAKLMEVRLFGDLSKSANKASDSIKKVAVNTKELYAVKKGQLGAEYDAARASAESYYDVLKMKSEDVGLSEVARVHYTLFLEKAKSQEMVILAEQEAKAKQTALSASGMDEKSIAEATKNIQKDLLNTKKKFYQESLDHLQTALQQALELEREYAAEVKRLKQEIADLDLSLADKIRSLRQRDMTDLERQADLALQVQEKLLAAQEAMASGDLAGGKDLAKQAGDIAYSLTDTATAINLLTQATDTEKAVLGEQIGAAEEGQIRAADAVQKFSGELEKLQTNLAAIEDKSITVKFEADVSEVDAVLSRLKNLQKKGVTSKYSAGGAVKGYAGGGFLGGYGGGDRRWSLLEDGEFIIRKEAVKKYGSFLFSMLNAMQMPNFKLPKYATGGQVAASGTVNLNLNMGSNTYKASASQSTADALQQAFGMEYLKTGGYRPAWEG